MPYLPPFILHGGLTAYEDGNLLTHETHWQTLLDQLAQDKVDLNEAEKLDSINEYLFSTGALTK